MIINTPVLYSEESQKLVFAYESDTIKHHNSYWEQDVMNPVKCEIKNHYKVTQNFTCVYCQKKMPVNHSAVWDTEHIVAREQSPKFMFTPKNLCVACKDCNGSKSNSNVLVNKVRVTYPTKSEDFIIIHPHFDSYEDHIAIFLNKIYTPKTSKGQKTIEMCNLLRFSYQAVGWDDSIAHIPNILDIADKILQESDEEIRKMRTMELLMVAQVSISKTLMAI